jgi:hypothetical protein
VQVTVTDAGLLTDVQNIAVTVTDVNETPAITSDGGGAAAAINAAENQTAVTNVESTDPDGETEGGGGLTYGLTGGADQALFSLDTNTGALTFQNAPNFETPTDAGGNNVYDVQVTVTDAGLLTDVQNIAVTVTDVNETPAITSDGGGAAAAINAAENQTAVTNVESTDPEGTLEGAGGLTYTITGGLDQTLLGIVANAGVLTFNAAPDFENPSDSGGNNVYEVQVAVTDPGGLTDVQDIAITVTDVNEPPTISSDGGGAMVAINAAEHQTAVTNADSTDPEGETENGGGLTYSLTGGADQTSFAIDTDSGLLTLLAACDFESPSDADGNNVFEVQVTVTDSGGFTGVQDMLVTCTDVNEAPTITGGAMIAIDSAENQTTATNVESTDPDGETEAGGGLTYSLTGGADQSLFLVDADAGLLTFNAAPDFEMPGDANRDNVYEVQVTVTDAAGLTGLQNLQVSVTNVNEMPVAGDDSAVTTDGTFVKIPVLGNDLDVDGDSFDLTSFVFDGSFAGQVDVDPQTGEVGFTPQTGIVGSQTITYQVADSNGLFSNVATLIVTIAPTSASLLEVSPGQFDLLISDVSSSGKNDNVTLRIDGGDLVISDATNLIANFATDTAVAENEVRVSLMEITGEITVDLLRGDDRLDVDLSGLGGGLDRSLTISGGEGSDSLVFSGPTAVGAGSLSTDPMADDIEGIFINANVTTVNAAVMLAAADNLEVNANINTAGGDVHLKAHADIFGDCSLIDAGGGAIELDAITGIGGVRLATQNGTATISSQGGVMSCNAGLDVQADSLTVVAATAIGTRVVNDGGTISQPLRTAVSQLDAEAHQLGIFISNQGPLTVQRAVAPAAEPGGIIDIATASPLTVDGEVQGGSIRLTAGGTGPDANVTLSSNARVAATAGNLELIAANSVQIADEAVAAPEPIIVQQEIANSTDPNDAGVASHWQNLANPLDVSGDTFVSSLDALLAINFLNTGSILSAATGESPAAGYVDVNGDRVASAIDVLLIINHLNDVTGVQAESEARRVSQDNAASYYVELPRGSSRSAAKFLSGNFHREYESEDVIANNSHAPPTAELISRESSDKSPTRRRMTFRDESLREWESLLDELAQDASEAWRLPRARLTTD